ncbi:spore germination protein KA [Sporobacter termitidis DSM 10068]|uniref:Spore germination protein KA n=1 Tax=Sporobacter termitidis DSM 10068 TaxID=1123282 RepID=A0A1M5YMS5_9FIRM|nr:spore germination protein [Sporobacter termitidis]SHI13296.1 spore germination protein KA [Sporobacter termitidis DSM 10068]
MFRKNKEKPIQTDNNTKNTENTEDRQLAKTLSENIGMFRAIFQDDSTIIFRDFENVNAKGFRCCLVYFDGMVNTEVSNENIINPIMNADILKIRDGGQDVLDILKNKVIYANEIKRSGNVDELLMALFSGDALIMTEGLDAALIVNSKGLQVRSLQEPGLEKVLQGPKEGFSETIITNLSLIRRRLKTPDLRFKFKEIGTRTKTRVCICYIDTLANDDILKELESRLDRISIDGIITSNYIDEMIKDSPLSPFKTIGTTERPDVVAAKLLEGRFAVIVDGTPSALTLPFVFMEYFQSADDYYTSFFFSSINRFLRCLGEFFTTSIPAIYVALITFHHEMIPTELLLSITAARQQVPFPSVIEALILLFTFEVIREAGVRMPLPMGQSVSIVGALVLGQAAIEARLFSAPMVIIIAATGITGLLTIKLKGASILIRLGLLLLAAFMGLYGYIFGVIGAFIYMFSLRSFGVPYMMNYGSINPVDLKDMFIRAPWWYMNYRTKHTAAKNVIRQKVPAKEEKKG